MSNFIFYLAGAGTVVILWFLAILATDLFGFIRQWRIDRSYRYYLREGERFSATNQQLTDSLRWALQALDRYTYRTMNFTGATEAYDYEMNLHHARELIGEAHEQPGASTDAEPRTGT